MSTCNKCGAALHTVANTTMSRCPACGAFYVAGIDVTQTNDRKRAYTYSELAEGETMLRLEKWKEAVECFDKLTQTNPLEVDVWSGLARALTQEQRYFELSANEFQRLRLCFNKIQALSGRVLDDSWHRYRITYDEAMRKKASDLQERANRLAAWVDNYQGIENKAIVKMLLFVIGLVLTTIAVVATLLNESLWFLILFAGALDVFVLWFAHWISHTAYLTRKRKRQACDHRDALLRYAKHYGLTVKFRRDIQTMRRPK